MKITAKTNSIVCIQWLDSYGVLAGWQKTDGFTAGKLEITSLGKVVYQNEDVISLAANFSEETENTPNQANGIMTIPKAAILSVTYASFLLPPIHQSRSSHRFSG